MLPAALESVNSAKEGEIIGFNRQVRGTLFSLKNLYLFKIVSYKFF